MTTKPINKLSCKKNINNNTSLYNPHQYSTVITHAIKIVIFGKNVQFIVSCSDCFMF